ncbi:MAG: hypothetical protein ACREIQ_09925 [Nitrospiria bacterium]
MDPYARADAHIIYLIDDGESVVELEEAYLTTLGGWLVLASMCKGFFYLWKGKS